MVAGEPPLYIGFGSMGFGKNAATRGATIREAVRRVGARAVVATGWGGIDLTETSDKIFVVRDIPHEWLLPRTAAVVHHGGAGTTAAGLRAGRPTLVCPVLGDQGFWAERIFHLGAGPRPIAVRRLTTATLTERLHQPHRTALPNSREQHRRGDPVRGRHRTGTPDAGTHQLKPNGRTTLAPRQVPQADRPAGH